MSSRIRHPQFAAGIIERFDNSILIVTQDLSSVDARKWMFPRGAIQVEEVPEEGMRRVALAQLGLRVEIVAGQPPLVGEVEGEEIQLRYFFCGADGNEIETGVYEEARWVSRAHLREYDFDAASQSVVDWLLEEERR